ncbi:EamA family transporter [Nocardioides sambongensis]|uniref:EamA family transporter n=1 Tax=Nocardioides sambongensis TaxID=2589074 RepID=UPI0018C8B74A|nr:EamA family transporter [Nocardioides sambongensis]
MAPVSAVGAALLPVVISVLTGERPAPLVWVGIVAALPGIWLVAREPDVADPLTAAGPPADEGSARGVVDGLLAGVGFGLLFVALGQIPDGAGFWPLALAQVVAVVTVIALATGFGVAWRMTRPAEAWGIVAGLVASAAVLFFMLASQSDLLTVAAVLTSLYPAVTVLLAAVVLREHIYRPQLLGLAFCGVAVALVAIG